MHKGPLAHCKSELFASVPKNGKVPASRGKDEHFAPGSGFAEGRRKKPLSQIMFAADSDNVTMASGRGRSEVL